MSGKKFLLIHILLITFGSFGLWVGLGASGTSEPRMWLGFLIVMGVGVGLLVAFHRDLREPESEKRAEWERAKARGRLSYVLGQVGLWAFTWGAFLLFSICELYLEGEGWGAVMQPIRRHAGFGVLGAVIYGVWSLSWWHRQEKKYEQLV
jgi:peptidoglycan/LPS O-acetylase OafA/YrhL